MIAFRNCISKRTRETHEQSSCTFVRRRTLLIK